MTMSGPVPVLDATAVCWRISSQPTKSTRVSIPVVCWNFAVLARKMVSSGSTKRAGRRTRKTCAILDRQLRRRNVGSRHLGARLPAQALRRPPRRPRSRKPVTSRDDGDHRVTLPLPPRFGARLVFTQRVSNKRRGGKRNTTAQADRSSQTCFSGKFAASSSWYGATHRGRTDAENPADGEAGRT